MSTERRRVEYDGHVQGVGFRDTAARLASGFGLSGFVRNLADGRVELEVQGDSARIQGFLSAIKNEFGSKIHRTAESILTSKTSPSDPETETDAATAFVIRY